MSTPVQQPVFVVFQDPAGKPLAGGTATFKLTFDISGGMAAAPQIAAGITVKLVLDSNGSGTVNLWPNDTMLPSGSKYEVHAYSSLGQHVWSGEITVAQLGCYLLKEDSSFFLLEDLTGFVLLETCTPPTSPPPS